MFGFRIYSFEWKMRKRKRGKGEVLIDLEQLFLCFYGCENNPY